MMTFFGRRCFSAAVTGLFLLFSAQQAMAAGNGPKIAVTDLTYEERVRSYFTYIEAKEKVGPSPFAGPYGQTGERSLVAASGEITWIERGELHKFTGDIKGGLIKSGGYRVMEGHPWADKTDPGGVKIFDVINRIKKGDFPGADYVLFGTITDISSRNEAIPIQNTNAVNFMLSMELVAEFSLIDTKTYQVVAGFSAMGEGNDSRLINTSGAVVQLNRGKVVREVSQSLADAVLAEITTQFPNGNLRSSTVQVPNGQAPAQVEAPVVYH